MKCVIFAGGKGSRIRTCDDDTPKPLITVGGEPIILHIIKIYYYYGIKDFVICLGYGQEKFKKYFVDLLNKNSDVMISYKERKIKLLNDNFYDINVMLVDTGYDTLTGGRLKRVSKYLKDDDKFLLTYGDAVSDIDIDKLIRYHDKNNKLVTITSVRRRENYGVIELDKDNNVRKFCEKCDEYSKIINAGFMVVDRKVFDYLDENSGSFEKEVLEKLSEQGQVDAYFHDGFWQCMDYQHEREYLEKLIDNNEACWLK